MDKVLEIQFSGWTATPKMPFILSGSPEGGSICLPTPTYSLLLGILGCCLGRTISSNEVQIGFYYYFDSIARDLEKRQRLQNKKGEIKPHEDGGDVYVREFHISPKLTIWINRLDWEQHFTSPIGTPSLGRSQDILKVESVRQISVRPVDEANISGCMLPYNPNLKIGGQLVQLAEAYQENEEVGSGRTATKVGIFMSVPSDNRIKIKFPHLYQTLDDKPINFYLHQFSS